MAAKQDNGEHSKVRKSTAGKRRRSSHSRQGEAVNVFIDKKRGRKTEVWIEPTDDADTK